MGDETAGWFVVLNLLILQKIFCDMLRVNWIVLIFYCFVVCDINADNIICYYKQMHTKAAKGFFK